MRHKPPSQEGSHAGGVAMALNRPPAMAAAPVCVDLDGTLIKTDTLWESLILLLKRWPWQLPLVLWWLLRGKAHLKRALACRVIPDPSVLPYRPQVLEFLEREKEAGKPLFLTTAADERVAQAVAAHLGLFDRVIASDGRSNCAGTAKLRAIRKLLGSRGFTYLGDSTADLPLWEAASQAYLVAPSRGLLHSARAVCSPRTIAVPKRNRVATVLTALRPHQWAKNLLVLVPLFLAHQVDHLPKLWSALVGLVSFCCCASAVYVLNDLVDVESDRRHPSKYRRPVAAGDLTIPASIVLGMLLGLAAFTLAAWQLSTAFVGLLAVYWCLTTAYSLFLKKRLLVDVLLLAGLYTFRIVAGAAAVDVLLSPWLLAFSMFFFLSLALGKRYIELGRTADRPHGALPGRGYCPEDFEMLQSLGPTSGFLAVLVYCLYIHSDAVAPLYGRPWVLWLICPILLYWISRFWLFARRKLVTDDPVVFALKDRASLCSIALTAVLLLLASA